MSDYDERLLRIRNKIAAAIEAHHREHGTTVPPADCVRVLNITESHATVGYPVMGEPGLKMLGMSVKDDAVQEHDIERIVANAGMWLRWHKRIPEITAELPGELARMTRGTKVEIIDFIMNGVNGTDQAIVVHYSMNVRQLNGALRHQVAQWFMQRNETDGKDGSWTLRENKSLLATQRKLTRLLQQAVGRPRMQVERALATRLLKMPNKRDASKKLFAAANGQIGTKVPWNSITLLEAREGRIVGTIPLSNQARIRDDTLTVKGARLPESVIGALRGRPAETVVDHPILHGRTIRTARNSKHEVIVELERDDIDCETLRRTLDGED